LGWPALTGSAVLYSAVIEYPTYWQVFKNDGESRSKLLVRTGVSERDVGNPMIRSRMWPRSHGQGLNDIADTKVLAEQVTVHDAGEKQNALREDTERIHFKLHGMSGNSTYRIKYRLYGKVFGDDQRHVGPMELMGHCG
jgi:hypothetical protein